MQRLNILVLMLLLFIPLLLTAQQKLPAYDLTVNIEPDTGSMAVRGSVEVSLENTSPTTFKFNLLETVTISRLRINGRSATYAFAEPESAFSMPASHGVVVTLPSGISHNRVRMDIEYSGPMKVLPEFGASPDWRNSLDDQVNSRMVELSMFSSWYPQFAFGQPLQANLALSLPQNWVSICSGVKVDEKVQNTRVLTHWSSPKDTAILILGSPAYKKKSFPDASLDIYYTRMPEPFLAQEGAQVAGIMKLYSALLGATNIPGGTIKHVYSPKRKGQGKAGMAVPGMIVTSEGITMEALGVDPKFSLFQGIAHEIGHYWWNFGAGQGDWINETFAEYFSAIAVGKLLSEDESRAIIADYRKQVESLPPDAPSLGTVPVMGPSGYFIRYFKGSLMLDDLRRTMGDGKFFQASREFFETYTGKPTGTPEFRAFWKEKMGDHRGLVDVWLDSRGRLPAGK